MAKWTTKWGPETKAWLKDYNAVMEVVHIDGKAYVEIGLGDPEDRTWVSGISILEALENAKEVLDEERRTRSEHLGLEEDI